MTGEPFDLREAIEQAHTLAVLAGELSDELYGEAIDLFSGPALALASTSGIARQAAALLETVEKELRRIE